VTKIVVIVFATLTQNGEHDERKGVAWNDDQEALKDAPK
jgi:hypothetical protein